MEIQVKNKTMGELTNLLNYLTKQGYDPKVKGKGNGDVVVKCKKMPKQKKVVEPEIDLVAEAESKRIAEIEEEKAKLLEQLAKLNEKAN